MKIILRSNQLHLDSSVREQIEHRIHAALDRFAERLTRITVYIVDLNGPEGGVDKSCRIELRLRHHEDIFVEETNADYYSAVDQAIERAQQVLIRILERSRDLTRKKKSPAVPLNGERATV